VEEEGKKLKRWSRENSSNGLDGVEERGNAEATMGETKQLF